MKTSIATLVTAALLAVGLALAPLVGATPAWPPPSEDGAAPSWTQLGEDIVTGPGDQTRAYSSIDARPLIRPFGTVVLEGDSGSDTANAVVYLEDTNGDPFVATETITVDWTTFGSGTGIAQPGSDYVAASGTLTFNPGDSQATVPITVKGDVIDEQPALYGEWLPIAFGNPSANARVDPVFFGLGIVIIVDEATDRGSGGCNGPSAPVTEMRTITTADSLVRDYRLHAPSSYDATQPTALVLNLHGHSDHMDRHLEVSRMEPLADTEGFVTVAPVGTLDDGSSVWGKPVVHWNVTDAPGEADDVAFIDQLLDRLESDLCLDLDRVFIIGMSQGARMASRLACTMPDRLAAVAAVAGFARSADPCGIGHTPAVQFHGDADTIVAFGPVAAAVYAWAITAGCTTPPVISTISGEVSLRSFAGCPAGVDIEQYVVEGGGHRWPGSPLPEDLEQYAEEIGYGTFDIDATALSWEFFQNHPMS